MILLIFILICSNAYAQFNSGPFGSSDGDININKHTYQCEEVDSTPSNPSLNELKFYCKDDAGTTKLYTLDSNGTETLLGSGSGSSQWITTGSDIYYSTGNVGIGTSSINYTFKISKSGANSFLQNTNPSGVTAFYTYNDNLNSGVAIGANGSAQSGTYGLAAPYIDMFGSDAFIGTSSSHDLKLMTGSSEVMRLTLSGNIGIGTPAPSNQLQVTKLSSSAIAYIDTRSGTAADTSTLRLSRANASNGNLSTSDEVGVVEFQGTNNGSRNNIAIISSQYTGNGTTRSGQMKFLTSSNAAPAERMVIQSDGNVGIGFASGGAPSAGLEIKKAGNPLGTSLRVTDSASGDYFSIIDGGNVGINSANPVQKLDVVGNIKATLFGVNGYSSSPQITNLIDTNTGLFFSGPDIAEFHTGGLNALIMTATQNVGVGTNSPSAKLYVYNNAASNSFRVDDETADTTPFIIDSVGNVGIGTTVLDSLVATPGVVKIGIPGATSAPLRILGGSGGTDLIRLERSSGATVTYGWSLAGGGLSFSDQTVGQTIMGLYGDAGGNQLYYGVRGATAAHTRPALLSAGSFNPASVGANVPGNRLEIQGGLGVGTANSGNIIFTTGNVGVGTLTAQNALTRMTIIGNSGNVGIGTANPGQKLDIGGTGDKLRMRSADGTVWNCAPANGTGVFTCS